MDIKNRELGIAAIIYLQNLAGNNEPEDEAAKAWDNFSDWEKEQTLLAHHYFVSISAA